MLPSPLLLWLSIAGLVVAALPVFVHPNLWIAVAVMWGVLLFAIALDVLQLLRAKPQLSAEVPKSVGVGTDVGVPVTLSLSKAGPFPTLPITLRPDTSEPLRAGADISVRTGVQPRRAHLVLSAPLRGIGTLASIWARLEGPFRLVRKIERFPVLSKVAVVPDVERVRELALAHFGAQPLSGVHLQRRRGDGGEFDRLEKYEPGMDLRKVDWKASARYQKLRVRRFRLEQNQRVILCVDTGRLMGDPIEDLSRLDHGVHAALLLAQVALRAGDQVGLQAYGEKPHDFVKPRGGIRQISTLRRSLADLHVSDDETNHVLGTHALLTRLKRRSLIVVFTEFVDPTSAELMVEHLGHLARKHLVVFVALDDPKIESRIDVRPEQPEDLAAVTVASGMRQDRGRVLRRLRRMGVDVIQAPPGPAALQLLDRYVRIKRRGLIG